MNHHLKNVKKFLHNFGLLPLDKRNRMVSAVLVSEFCPHIAARIKGVQPFLFFQKAEL